MTWTQTTLLLKDANGTSQPVIAYTDGTNFSFAHPLLDNTGAIIAPATSSNQATEIASLATIATNSALASTSALQTSGNTILSAIETALTGTLEVAGNVGITGTVPLPTGAATAANQSTSNTSLAAIATSVANIPASGATAANQTTGNTSLATIATNTTGVATAANQATANTSLATIAASVAGATPAGSNTIGAVASGVNVIAGNTLTRPANTTAYAFGELIANSTTAGSVIAPTIAAARGTNIPTAGIRCRLQKTSTSTTNAIFRVHFWNSAPTVANGDGGTFTPTFANYCGSFDVTCNLAGSDYAFGIGVPTAGPFVAFLPATGTSNLYYLIEARAAYTPASAEVFTPILEIQ